MNQLAVGHPVGFHAGRLRLSDIGSPYWFNRLDRVCQKCWVPVLEKPAEDLMWSYRRWRPA